MFDYKKIITNKNTRLRILNFLKFIPDKLLLKVEYKLRIGKKLNLESPKYFTEKLQWLKLYDRKDIYTQMVDKYHAKQFLAEKIGEQYVVPTLGCWSHYDEIDFSLLPDKFVLKCTHDSGSVILCDDKTTFNHAEAKKKLEFHLKNDEYILGREWPYKNVPRRIIAEVKLDEGDGKGFTIKDYKFFCFNGEPRVMYISNDRGDDPRTDFFDMNFQHLPIHMKDPNADILPDKPAQFEKMKEIAAILSDGIPHLRVDFYAVGEKIYVGEMTFFHNSGFTSVQPEEWDLRMGEWITLPAKDN